MAQRSSSGASAIILAGGLGSRLGALASEVPKPMLPVGGRPFVEYVVLRLARSGFDRIVFATGHRSDPISRHFGDGSNWGISISYSHETEPLGTGGAIRLAFAKTTDDPVAVLNGDSFLDIDPRLVVGRHGPDIALAMAVARVPDGRRFGRVELAPDGLVTGFTQGDDQPGPALINAGIYGVRRHVLAAIPAGRPVSFERDILPGLAGNRLRGVVSDGFFVDIGVPDVYLGLRADPGPLLTAAGVVAVE